MSRLLIGDLAAKTKRTLWLPSAAPPPPPPGPTFVRFGTLSNMTESGNGTTGWIYTGTAADGTAGNPDYTLATGVAGGVAVQMAEGGSSADPMLGFYTSVSGTWDADIYSIAYESGGNWFVNDASFADLVTTPRTYAAGDLVRYVFGTGNTFTVDIARSGAPTTWLSLGGGTITRSGTLYPRLTSFGATGAVLTAPQVV